jgi:type II secretory pathway pseudopilin PulG
MKKPSFTLIELLISITILILTISIALISTIGSNSIIFRTDSRSAITDSGRTVNEVIRTSVKNASYASVSVEDSGKLLVAGAVDQKQNKVVCHFVGRAEPNGSVFSYNMNGKLIVYWLAEIQLTGTTPNCGSIIQNGQLGSVALFQNQIISSKTEATDLSFYYADDGKAVGELRYKYTLRLKDAQAGLSAQTQRSVLQYATTLPIGLESAALSVAQQD